MAQPVWVLSVDLQTKTATFQSGLGDAARAARGSFTEIKEGARAMGAETGYSMSEARHGVMLLGEEFGIHIPRALTSFLAGLGPIGAAMEAAFPFLAIAVGATLLIEHLVKMREEGEKLTTSQVNFGTTCANVLNALDDKLLQAGIRADELNHNHFAALEKQLTLIDHQSMKELVKSFEEVAKAADLSFGPLITAWYQFGAGAGGAKHSLEQFKIEYDALLSKGNELAANDLLNEKIKREERILALQKQITASQAAPDVGKQGDYGKFEEAKIELKKMDADYDEKAVQAQTVLVTALQNQVTAHQRIQEIKKLEGNNAKQGEANRGSKEQSEGARQEAEHTLKMGELRIAAERQAAQLSNTLHHATIQERLQGELQLAESEHQIQERANQQKIAALDKNGKEYLSQLRALHNAAEELTAQHENKIAQLKGKAQEDQYHKEIQDLERSERGKIEETENGSAARLAAIDAAIKQANAKGLQETSFYSHMLESRAETSRQMGKEQKEIAQKLADEELQLELSKGTLIEQVATGLARHKLAIHKISANEEVKQAIAAQNALLNTEITALDKRIAALDKSDAKYITKLQEFENKKRELTLKSANEVNKIEQTADEKRVSTATAAYNRMGEAAARTAANSIMHAQSMGQAFEQLGAQMIQAALTNALQMETVQGRKKLNDAKTAAADAYADAGNPILGAVAATLAFTSVMAFHDGGIVPGVGYGDIVPAMLEPGETVIPKAMTERLSSGGGGGPVTHNHIHVRPTYNLQAIDTTGVQQMLDKHTGTIQKHVENTLRKMNRG
jgi:hypothetical protein